MLAAFEFHAGLDGPATISWLRELAAEQPLRVWGCRADTLVLEFPSPVRDPARLARRLLGLRPDELGVIRKGDYQDCKGRTALARGRPWVRLGWD